MQGAIERAAPTLAAAHAISRAVSIPVMAASGLSDITAPMALAAGAKGVGVGSAGEETRDRTVQFWVGFGCYSLANMCSTDYQHINIPEQKRTPLP